MTLWRIRAQIRAKFITDIWKHKRRDSANLYPLKSQLVRRNSAGPTAHYCNSWQLIFERSGIIFTTRGPNTTGGHVFTAMCLPKGVRGYPWSLVNWSLVLSGEGYLLAASPWSFRGGGAPCSPPCPVDRPGGQGVPPPPRRTGYAAGGTPLAVTQDFLVVKLWYSLLIRSNMDLISNVSLLLQL